jgi:hypothetical protein
MNRFFVTAIALAFIGAAACPAFAEEGKGMGETIKDTGAAAGNAVGRAVKGAAETTGETLGLVGSGKPTEATSAEVATYDSTKKAEHRMTGAITSIDHDTGNVVLKSGDMTVALFFPPESIKDMKDGQLLSVDLAFVELPVAAGEARAGDAPAKEPRSFVKGSQHWMKGTVQNIDRTAGTFEVKTGDATLKLHYPPSEIASLENGDAIAVEVAIAEPRPT